LEWAKTKNARPGDTNVPQFVGGVKLKGLTFLLIF